MPCQCWRSEVKMDRLVGDCKEATVNYRVIFSSTFGGNFTAQSKTRPKPLVILTSTATA